MKKSIHHPSSIIAPPAKPLATPGHHPSKGFTLLELLVVIAIIGILIAIGTASYASAQKKARDSKRKGDMKAVQSTLEQYYAVNNSVYPDTQAEAKTISPEFPPIDPKNDPTNGYVYTGLDDTGLETASYCICAKLEGGSGGNASDTGCSWSSGGAYFCVKNLQ